MKRILDLLKVRFFQGPRPLAAIATCIALASGQSAWANTFQVLTQEGALSVGSLSNYQSLRQRAVAEDGVQLTVGYLLPENLGDISRPGGLGANQAAVLSEVADFEQRYAAFMLSPVVHASLTPVLEVKLNAAGVDQLLTDPKIIRFSVQPGFKSQLRETNASLQTSALPIMGTAGSSNQLIAVVDSGVGIAQAEFSGRVVAGACFSTPDGNFEGGGPLPSLCANTSNTGIGADGAACASSNSLLAAALENCGHGTHVTGIALGEPNVAGVKGLAPAANLMAIQAGSVFATGNSSKPYDFQYRSIDVVEALDYAFVHRNDAGRTLAAVNLSLGYFDFWGAGSCRDTDVGITTSINRLVVNGGVAVVAAIGNNPVGIDYGMAYPACLPNVISVGATGRSDGPTNYSMYGFDTVDKATILAPGGGNGETFPPPGCQVSSSNTTGICAAKLGGTSGQRESRSGTSMSAPVVSGLIARLRDRFPHISGVQAGALLVQTGVPILVNTRAVQNVPVPRVAPVAAFRSASLPRNVGAAPATCAAVGVNWSAPLYMQATGYNLRFAPTTKGLGSAAVFDLGNVQTATLSDLSASVYVQVQAYDARGAGEWTDALQAVPVPCVPAQVIGLQNVPGPLFQCGDVTVANCVSYEWSAVATATHYEIEESANAIFNGIASKPATGALTSHGQNGLYARVRACSGAGCGAWSNTLAITVGIDQ